MKHPSISYLTQEKDEQLLLSRILDKQAFCQKRNIPAYTPFLSPRMQMLARQLLAPAANLCFFGGIEEAERQMLFFLPDYETGIIDPNNSDCPICALQTSFPPQTPVTHRDILGALMGMGISREKLGDILMTPTHCTLLLQKELQRFLQEQMTQAGRARLHWQPFPLGEVERPPQKVEAIAGTVSSLRLDAVCALGFGTSRTRIAEQIAAGNVSVNYQPCCKPERSILQGDVISLRGKGKFRVEETGGKSRKGRSFLKLSRYR
ncbi:MAG: RNA-binding protein [Oscillospiraceae bacterium]|nr:RNA-binding protein [Oscillospiraceae bacterium]